MKPYQNLVEHWRACGLIIAAGAPQEGLGQFERNYGVRLSSVSDFREYLLHVDGMAQTGGQDCDEKGFAFWPLSRIKSVPEECAENRIEMPRLADIGSYFAFADYMQWSWAYAISLAPTQLGKILQFGTKSPCIVADSFSQFVIAYLADSEQLYLCEGRK
jgi:hypothetical protein